MNPFSENTSTVAELLPPEGSVTEGLDVIAKFEPLCAPGVAVPVVVSFMSGAVTVKLAEAEFPLGLLVAVTVYGPAVTFATMNEPDSVPLDTEQVPEVTGAPDNVQVESVEGKPEPKT